MSANLGKQCQSKLISFKSICHILISTACKDVVSLGRYSVTHSWKQGSFKLRLYNN